MYLNNTFINANFEKFIPSEFFGSIFDINNIVILLISTLINLFEIGRTYKYIQLINE